MLSSLAHAYFKYVSPRIKRFSPIGTGPVWDRRSLPWLADIEQAHAAITAEIDAYLSSGHRLPDKEELNPGNTAQYGTERWEMLHLMICGEQLEPVIPHFPETMAALRTVPGLCTVMFSRLPPERKYIPRHRDGDSGTLRMHLGLRVPDRGKCHIEIARQILTWKTGQAFVMDVGANEHEVRKDTEQERIVLIVDFFHPLPFWAAWPSQRLYRAYVGKSARAMLHASYRKLEGVA